MANIREIKTRIKSVSDTMQLTHAMNLIASSKLKKARKQLAQVEPYFMKIQSVMTEILQHSTEIHHVYFDTRDELEVKKKGYVLITSDKGLAGSYNHNVIRIAEDLLKENNQTSLFTIGRVGRQFFANKKVLADVEFLYTAQDPTIYRAREISETLIELFKEKVIDEVYVIYTKMISTVKLQPEVIKLLPLERSHLKSENEKGKIVQIAKYLPSKEVVFNNLVPQYLKGIIYGAMVESFSSEQAARMIAMDAATDSAKEMIDNLSLSLNRARQAMITQEISEIVSGAEALKTE